MSIEQLAKCALWKRRRRRLCVSTIRLDRLERNRRRLVCLRGRLAARNIILRDLDLVAMRPNIVSAFMLDVQLGLDLEEGARLALNVVRAVRARHTDRHFVVGPSSGDLRTCPLIEIVRDLRQFVVIEKLQLDARGRFAVASELKANDSTVCLDCSPSPHLAGDARRLPMADRIGQRERRKRDNNKKLHSRDLRV